MKNALKSLVQPLLQWYDKHARVLPWREQPTPYRVWVSEIMLQQTRVEAVKPYYERFMRRLPDIRSLSEVGDDELLKLWEGLGYYNRARNLKKAAVMLMEQYGGEMPASYDQILSLPGIGSYTAGAIASIAFGLPYPAVDGNVLRVIARACRYEADVLSASAKREMEQQLKEVIPHQRVGAFNQALMELGATVCVPNGAPHCAECPWEKLCKAHEGGMETAYPIKKPKKTRTVEEYTILILQDEDQTAIRKRPEKGLLAGMYEFPWVEGIRTKEEVIRVVKAMGYAPIYVRELERSRHIFTHKEWHMAGYAIRVDELEKAPDTQLLFARAGETEEKYPMPAAFCAYTRYLHIRLGNERFS
ncbi:MAG: A/G-specific adenine glycosylase [Lachnospiraceae bacterium]|nr:A/G-specific adenine glycosylase [Lachnospiraceae bacterium]MBD5481761.1 A/G-specific adenine glycosylase [Lachnospiraceae bacterium]